MSTEFDIGACLESPFPSFLRTYDATALHMYRRSGFIVYSLLPRLAGLRRVENKCGHLQAIYVYVGKSESMQLLMYLWPPTVLLTYLQAKYSQMCPIMCLWLQDPVIFQQRKREKKKNDRCRG